MTNNFITSSYLIVTMYVCIFVRLGRIFRHIHEYTLLDKKRTHHDTPRRYKANWTQIDTYTGCAEKCKVLHFRCY